MQQHTLPAPGKATGTPIEALGPRISIYTPEFAADPHRAYKQMRENYGALVPVELAPGLSATSVIDYRTAVNILTDPEHFSADPREWQKTLHDRTWPILAMLKWRPNALRSNGEEHLRYRRATHDALAGINQYGLRALVERTAVAQVNTFCRSGSADLLSQYCLPVVFSVVTQIIGCTPQLGEQLVAASAALFDGQDNAEELFDSALRELTWLKRTNPGDDVATRLVRHPAKLSDDEMVQQLLTIISAAIEVPQNWIANTLLLMLTDPLRFIAGLNRGLPPSTSAALAQALFTNPPMSHYCLTYPVQPILVGKVWLPAHQPVITSMTACNSSPEVNTGQYTGNDSHLAYGAGPHACPKPARIVAELMAETAIDQLLDFLPETRLAIPAEELEWRPGPLHRALSTLPVTFPPSPAQHIL